MNSERLDARAIIMSNIDGVAREIDVYNVPAVREFVNKYGTPDNEVDYNDAFTQAVDRAFVIGFNTAVKFLISCVMGKEVR
jgi:hypothetical protein